MSCSHTSYLGSKNLSHGACTTHKQGIRQRGRKATWTHSRENPLIANHISTASGVHAYAEHAGEEIVKCQEILTSAKSFNVNVRIPYPPSLLARKTLFPGPTWTGGARISKGLVDVSPYVHVVIIQCRENSDGRLGLMHVVRSQNTPVRRTCGRVSHDYIPHVSSMRAE